MIAISRKYKLAILSCAVPLIILVSLSCIMRGVSIMFAVAVTLIAASVISLLHPLMVMWLVGWNYETMLDLLGTCIALCVACSLFGVMKTILNICWAAGVAMRVGKWIYVKTEKEKEGTSEHGSKTH